MLLGLVPACESSAPPAQAVPDIADASTLLAGHAAAVRTHSVAEYLADVDSDPSAAAFRAQEERDITNLAGVPIARWSYADPQLVTDRGALATAARRLGAKPLIVHVILRYALADVDPLPTQHDQWLTFVERDGRTVLSADDALAGAGSPSWAGPWRFGPLSVARGKTSLVLGPAGASLSDVAAAVDAAVPDVTAVWGTDWNRRIAVIVAGSEAEFGALLGSGRAIRDISAAAVTDGIDPVSGRAYGQRLVVAPQTLGTATDAGEQIVLRHELTHLATAAVTDPTTPRWVVEGFADYVGNRGSGQPVPVAASELAASVRAGRVPPQLPDEAVFGASGADLARAYEASWLACRLLAERAGEVGLVRFYRTVGGATLPAADALATGLRDAVHLSLAGFTAQWRDYLREQLG